MATQAQLDAIDAAIASGALIVRNGEKHLTYRSMDELLAARAAIVAQLSAQANVRGPRYMTPDFSDS